MTEYTEEQIKSMQLRIHLLDLAIRASIQGTHHEEIVQTANAFQTYIEGEAK